ncbi:dienelactone hydrolase [Ramlibacter sp.]|uniref:alpha/beta hydrolase family protein n=1 Tax=Ramlibacter sp. TaxID=1917967 RepID=UPI00262D3D73|nr:dienelactone hydrolase [Ramlibacter sp.]MDB5958144.1 dienelactone hydrolase [Ramlibacter sp.]
MHSTQRLVAGSAILLAAMLAASASFAAGIQALNVPADASSPAMSGAVWYPCALPPTQLRLGPFLVSAARDCPLAGTKLPLIVMSHGRAGTFLGHRDTAQALADAGFIVAAISHPGDNAQDSSSSNEVSAFIQRPADIKRLVDHLLGAWPSASVVAADRIGFFGFSRGGYTGLVLAGAVPRLREGQPTPVAHDPRIKAAVIADPLTLFFAPDAFGAVGIPIQLWRSEQGGDGVTPEGVAAVAVGLPAKPDLHTVAAAGHFAFLPPCPEALRQSAREICTDAPGFDRQAFHDAFNAQVVEFFRRTLH